MRTANAPKPPNKEAYEAPRAKISLMKNDDILTNSNPDRGDWDPQPKPRYYY